MKKGLKITLIIAGAVLMCCVLVLAFGGIVLVNTADRDFNLYTEHHFELYPYADRGVPADYTETMTFSDWTVPTSNYEWTISTPVKLECLATGDENESRGRKQIYSVEFGDDQFITVYFASPSDMEEADLTGASEGDNEIVVRFRDYILNGYARKHGYEITDTFSFFDYILHLDREHPGISLHSGMAYYGFAKYQNELLGYNDLIWEMHTENADGYFYREDSQGPSGEYRYGGCLDLCPKDDRSMTYMALVKASDEEMLTYILNSMDLRPCEAKGE